MTESIGAAAAPAPRIAPGPRGNALLGSLRDVQRDPLGMLLSAAEAHGDVVRFRFGPMIAHSLRDPAHVQHVLVAHAKNYRKQTRGFRKLRLVLGDGLLTSEGDFWLRQRRIAQPAFHRQRIAGFATQMVRVADECAGRLAEAARTGAVVDVAAEMMRLALQIVSRTLFATDVSGEADRIGAALTTILRSANRRMTRLIDLPLRVPTPDNVRFNAAVRELDALVLGLIAERRKRAAEEPDLLGMLMAARDEVTGEAMTDRQLRDEAMTILLAGHETTANALSWTWMLLSQHPAEARALRAELAQVLGGRAPGLDDLPRLVRTRATLDESMRLYPPAWTIARSVYEDDVIGGFHIPRGSIVLVSPYVVHRNARLFENPEGFDPERFLRRPESALPRFAYFPFGGGPRICIGNAFALMEAQLVLAHLAQRVELSLVPGHPLDAEPSITLRPRRGMKMKVRALSPSTGAR